MNLSKIVCVLLAAPLVGLFGGCASYQVPGRAADFRALGITPQQQAELTDAQIAVRLARKPAANFPAAIAAVRVQDGAYTSHTWRPDYRGERGQYSVVTVRDVETDEQFQRLAKLPMVRGVAPLNSLVVPRFVNKEMDLRSAAANLQADVVMIYTFDTVFGTDTIIPALGFITLGLFPDREARVTSTASAVFVDTRTGYIYGLSEATAHTAQLANAWSSADAVDASRKRAEKDAFEKLVGEMEGTWRRVAAEYGPKQPTSTISWWRSIGPAPTAKP